MSSITSVIEEVSHILVFPFPAQGHMLALLDLTHQLSLNGLKITILVTPKNLPILNTLLSTHPNTLQTLVLPFPPTHPNHLPIGVENVKDIGNSGNTPMILALSKLEHLVITWFKSHNSPPQAIISDFFLGFTNNWAKKLEIPRFGFFSTRAFLSCAFDHLLQNVETLGNLPRVDFVNFPGSPSFVEEHLPTLFRHCKNDVKNVDSSSSNLIKDFMLENFKSYGLVFNTFYALEGEYLDFIKEELGHNRVYGVGPLNSIGVIRANPIDFTGNHVLNWLDKCDHGSVVYVSFGSQKWLTRDQMEALAIGLEKSETRFVWVVKSEASELVPGGFEDRVSNRGLVVYGWAPQVEILNHKAVGGFVSHCGWNSILESIEAGILVLAWPMEADQYVNARLLVEDLGFAVRICEGADTLPDPDMLGRVIRESIGSDMPEKGRAKMIRDQAFKAIEIDGTSFSDLHELVHELSRLRVASDN